MGCRSARGPTSSHSNGGSEGGGTPALTAGLPRNGPRPSQVVLALAGPHPSPHKCPVFRGQARCSLLKYLAVQPVCDQFLPNWYLQSHQSACLFLSSHVIRAQRVRVWTEAGAHPQALPSCHLCTDTGWVDKNWRGGRACPLCPRVSQRRLRLYWAPVLLGGLRLCKLLPHPRPPARPKAPQVLGGQLPPPHRPAWPGGPALPPTEQPEDWGGGGPCGGTGTPTHTAAVVRVGRRVTHRQGVLQPPPLPQLLLPALCHIPQGLLQTPRLRRIGRCRQGHPVGAAPEGPAPSTSPGSSALRAGPLAARAPKYSLCQPQGRPWVSGQRPWTLISILMACTMVWTRVGGTGWVPGVPWWGRGHYVGSWGAMVGWGVLVGSWAPWWGGGGTRWVPGAPWWGGGY